MIAQKFNGMIGISIIYNWTIITGKNDKCIVSDTHKNKITSPQPCVHR